MSADAAKDMGSEANRGMQSLFQAVAERGRSMLTLIQAATDLTPKVRKISKLAEDILGARDDATGHKYATELFACYHSLPQQEKIEFLNLIANGYGPDPAALDKAVAAYRLAPSGRAIADLRAATDSPRQVFFRRLNLANNGTLHLIRMREDALQHQSSIANFDLLDADFSHVITPWFNAGFLDLQQMLWTSSANVLHKVITYEAVHEIKGWDDLRRRVEPEDRRCYAFFHPRMPDEPLIFVEVALTQQIPACIATLLDEERTPIAANSASIAVFYSISNCQDGLRGIPFGNILIKRVVELLSRELPMLKTFVTLSPVPGFASWLARQREAAAGVLSKDECDALGNVRMGWNPLDGTAEERAALVRAAARYFLEVRTPHGRPVNAVARFHLGNGARLERINYAADLSPTGLQDAHGLMVNYLYDRKRIETNVERYAESSVIATSAEVRHILEPRRFGLLTNLTGI